LHRSPSAHKLASWWSWALWHLFQPRTQES
jgi:hypothetical protein